jgi:sugar phosphate isomerase/epimerase
LTPLSYGTNVHPAEDLPALIAQFDQFAVPVRERLGVDRLGLGLWLAADVAATLASDGSSLVRLRRALTSRGLRVVTLNAFPYRGFHQRVVKRFVYRPRWTEAARLHYTADCAVVLAGLLDDDADYGSISTLPLGWREPWTAASDALARAALDKMTARLRAISARQGRPIVLAVEPEPGCVLGDVAEAVGWLTPRVDAEFVGICLDTCHLGVSFADPATAVRSIYDAGLRVVKVQISAALHVEDPMDPAGRAALAGFAEPRYLHQVSERCGAERVLTADDLPQALAELPGQGPWRVHYHVPLHAAPPPPLSATTDVIRQALSALASCLDDHLPHLEVETYTWEVLPPGLRQNLVDGIAAELRWAADNVVGCGVGP